MGLAAFDSWRRAFTPKLELAADTRMQPDRAGQRAPHALLFSLFAVANLVLFKFFLSLAYFDEVRSDLRQLFGLLFSLIALALLAYVASDVFRAARVDLRTRKFSVQFNIGLALVFAAAPVVVGLLQGRGAAYEALLVLLFVVALDRHVERSFLKEMGYAASPDRRWKEKPVRVLKPGPGVGPEPQLELQLSQPREQEVLGPGGELRPGDVIRLSAGCTVPCDAVVRSGSCEVLERKIGGWGRSCIRSAGMRIFAGSELRVGDVRCEVLQSAEESEIEYFFDQMQKNRARSEEENAPPDASLLNLGVLFIAISAGFYWYGSGAQLKTVAGVVSSMLLVSALGRAVGLLGLARDAVIGSYFMRGLFLKSFAALRKMGEMKNIIFDYDCDDPPGEAQVLSFELFDTRIDEDSLASTLAALLGRADGEAATALAEFLRRRVRRFSLHEVSDFHSYPGKGICGKVHGCEFRIGSEAFLIESGVHIQASEVEAGEPEGAELWYAALRGEILAKFAIAPRFIDDGRRLQAALGRLGVKTGIFARHRTSEVEFVARCAEVPIVAEGDPERVAQSITPPFACYLAARTDIAPWRKRAGLVLSVFHELVYDVKSADVTLLDRDVSTILSLIRRGKKSRAIGLQNRVFGITLGLLLLIAGACGLASPASVAVSVLLGTFFLFLNTWRILSD